MPQSASSLRAQRAASIAHPDARSRVARAFCRADLIFLDTPYGQFQEEQIRRRTVDTLRARGQLPEEVPLDQDMHLLLNTIGQPIRKLMRQARLDIVPEPGSVPPVVIVRNKKLAVDVRPGGQVLLSNTLVKKTPTVSSLALLIAWASAKHVLREALRGPLGSFEREELILAIRAHEMMREEPLPPEVKAILYGRALRNESRGESSKITATIHRQEALVGELDRYAIDRVSQAGFSPHGFPQVAAVTAASADVAQKRLEAAWPLLQSRLITSDYDKNFGAALMYFRKHLDGDT